jgi:flagellar basal body-associated protein FliL
MKNIKLILSILLSVLAAFMLYYIFTQKSQLKEANAIIDNVNKELVIVKDSLEASQISLNKIINQLDYTSNQLDILKNERSILELEEQKKRIRNRAELEVLKQQILKLEEEKNRLKREAEKFDI